MKIHLHYRWTDIGGSLTTFEFNSDDLPDHAAALQFMRECEEDIKRVGWTVPRWWQWWRWRDVPRRLVD